LAYSSSSETLIIGGSNYDGSKITPSVEDIHGPGTVDFGKDGSFGLSKDIYGRDRQTSNLGLEAVCPEKEIYDGLVTQACMGLGVDVPRKTRRECSIVQSIYQELATDPSFEAPIPQRTEDVGGSDLVEEPGQGR